jgi:type II secretory pathway component GspD/PulD (secretin)
VARADAEKHDMRSDQTRRPQLTTAQPTTAQRSAVQRSRAQRSLAAFTLGATAALALSASALAQSAGSAQGLSDAGLGSTGSGAATRVGEVDLARSLMEQDRLIEARVTLDRLIGSSRFASLDDRERTAALSTLKSVDAKIQSADPLEISLQKAEQGVAEGDLLQAERQARAVLNRSSATGEQQARARAIAQAATEKREQLAAGTADRLAESRAAMAAGDHGAAKATILGLMRSGVALTPEQSRELETQQLKIVELEQRAGKAFEVPAPTVAAMQPGQVRRAAPRAEAGRGDAGRAEPLPETLAQGGGDPAYPSDPAPVQPAEPVQLPPSNLPPPAPMIADAPPPAPVMQSTPQDDIVTAAMRAEAQRIIAEADQAFDQARYGVAADKYTLALAQFRQYLPASEISRAEARIAEARVRLAGAGGGSGGDIARDVIGSQTLIRDRARAEFNSFVDQANSRLAEGAADRAQDLAAQAQLSISRARSAFNDAEMAEFTTRLETLRASITAKRDEIAKTEAERRQRDLETRAAQTEANRLAERDRKVGESIDRIRALQAEQKYDEALQVADQTLFLDPNNPTALLLRDILRDISIYRKYNDIEADKAFFHAKQSLQASEATIPPDGFMNFPSDWPAKTFTRGETAAFADSPENRKVLAQISANSSRTNLDLNENRFEDAVKFLQGVTQINFDVDWEALAAVGVERDTLVTLKLNNATVKTILDRLTAKVSRDQFAKAGWSVSEGVVVVSSDEALRRNRTLVIYNIQDLLFEIPNYPDVPQIDLNNVLQQSQGGGGGGQSPFTNVNNTAPPAPDREARIRQIVDIIQQNVDFDGWKDNGGETGALQELNGSLIITNTPTNHREIVGLLSKLREIRNMQINVETKFLLVNQNWFEQIGFDLDIIWNANSQQAQNARNVDPSVRPSDLFNFSSQAGQSIGLQRQVTGFGPTGGQLGPITSAQRINQATVAPGNFSPIANNQNSLGLTNSLAEGDFATGILAQAPALGIAGQFLDDVQVDFLIQATQADKRSVRLTAPRLTFTNGQQANIYVVTQQAFVSDLQPIVGDSAVGFDPTTSVLSEGVTMLVEGVISSDRRYVTLNIDAGVARLDGFQQSSVAAVAGGQLVNSANTQSFIQLPQITVTRVRTTATVPDEGTVLLGGQRLVTEVEVETGVPVLSKIPIINRFFTNRLESKEEQTLLILVKPTILIQTEQEEKNFPGLLDSVRTGLTR